jgi:serine/threonine-protein kinase
MLQSDTGILKLIDFGIAIELDGDEKKEYDASGSKGYSAPEQLDPKVRTDERADIYALGATLYTLATGNMPHRAEDESISMEFVFDGTMNEGLEHVIRRATNKNRERRYQSIDDLRVDLENNEQFAEEYRAVQQRKVAVFRNWLIATVSALVIGIVCLLASNALTGSSYDSNMHEASVASRVETVNRDTKGGSEEAITSSPSDAEQALTRAIQLRTGRIDPYEELIKLYKDDLVLSPGESERFTNIYSQYGSNVNTHARFGKLNYDAGIMYLCYYDALAYDSDSAGAGAVSNARRAAKWFEAARTAYDSGLQEGMNEADRKAVNVYLTIADFYDEVSQSAYEGTSNVELLKTFWDALKETVSSLSKADEAAVRLRLYQVAYQAIASPAYLRGFYRAGIDDTEMYEMLDVLDSQLEDVSGEVAQNEQVLRPIYTEIKSGIPSARENVRSTYGNPVDGSVRAGS